MTQIGKVLILDEATSSLDSENRKEGLIDNLFNMYKDNEEKSIVVIGHSKRALLGTTKRIKLTRTGTLED